MRQRGRASAAALELLKPTIRVNEQRPDPPSHLTPDQAREWREIVARMPPGWFPRETHELLADYCRHVVGARKIAVLINQAESRSKVNIEEYDRLRKMAERETRILASLATKMRISQQTTYDKTHKKGPASTVRPWDDEDDDRD